MMELRCLVCLIFMTTFFVPCPANNSATKFLEKYGYLKESEGSSRGEDRPPEVLNAAIKHFQKFAGLKVTGLLDDDTKQKMQQSRCGVKDILPTGTTTGSIPAPMYMGDPKWPKKDLTWSVTKYSQTSKLSRKKQLSIIRQAFEKWSEVAHLNFQEVKGKADIVLSFERFEHGDKDSFDGRGKTLAHAYAPVDGRTHFDDDEDWTSGIDEGTNLEHVATHEIGHALGLYHLPGTDPIMSPFYPGYVPNFKLHRYDIMEIQRLYGKRQPVREVGTSSFCGQEYEKIYAAMRMGRNSDYIFVDRKLVISGLSGRKTFIPVMFPKGPKTVDAAVYSELAKTVYLFKGLKVWAYDVEKPERFTLKDGFPKDVGNSQIQKPEAAIRIMGKHGLETILLIKDGRMWGWLSYHDQLAPGVGLPVEKLFPRIPQRIDAAISGENNINFIVGKKFYSSTLNDHHTTKHIIPIKNLLKCSK